MKLTRAFTLVGMVAIFAISACSKSGSDTNGNPQGTSNPPAGNNYPKPKSLQEMADLLSTAIKALTPTVYWDISAMNLADNQIDPTVSNAYSSAMNKDSSLKYAYKVVPIYNPTAKVLQVTINYMPYKLGIDPATVPAGTKKINSYNDLITATVTSPLGQEIPIAITNKSLDVSTMQLILTSNCGYGYIVYLFNADATAIVGSPSPVGLPGAPTGMGDCITRINRIKDSANQILARIVTPGMTSDQKLSAIYNFVTRAEYDWNYNTPNLLFDSQTAFGNYVNKKTVCGGFSWAFNVLANTAGIPCYNVSGSDKNGTGHAWSRALYNGSFYYFDCTWDNLRTPAQYIYFAKTEDFFKQGHVWNNAVVNALVAEK